MTDIQPLNERKATLKQRRLQEREVPDQRKPQKPKKAVQTAKTHGEKLPLDDLTVC